MPPTASVTWSTETRPSHSVVRASTRCISSRIACGSTSQSRSKSTDCISSLEVRVQFSNGVVVK